MSKKVVLAGGSGFLGTSLAHFLTNKGYEVVILTRNEPRIKDGVRYVQWDGRTVSEWFNEFEGAVAIINFTGKSVNCIYTKKNKEEIIQSRVNSVRAVNEAIRKCKTAPKVLIQAGSLAIFGDTKNVCTEDSPHGSGFSVEVCERWEEEFFKENLKDTRQVLLRIGFALGKNGGALQPLQQLAEKGLGGTVGSGKQYISWIHIDDLNEMFLYSMDREDIKGIYNATGPSPVTNKEFMATLRTVLGKGWAPPAPTPFVILGAYLIMRAAPELALTGRNCIPRNLLDKGFSFKYHELNHALNNIINDAS